MYDRRHFSPICLGIASATEDSVCDCVERAETGLQPTTIAQAERSGGVMPRFSQRVTLSIRRFVPAAAAKQGAMSRVSRTAFSAGLTSTVVAVVLAVALVTSLAQPAFAQTKTDPLQYFKSYFLTGGDYVVGGWQKKSPPSQQTFNVFLPINNPNNTNNVSTTVPYLVGKVAIPDTYQNGFLRQGTSQGVPTNPGGSSQKTGVEVVAAYLYWQTVESTSGTLGWGQVGFFQSAVNTSSPIYQITGTLLQSASPVGWSAGGCTGSSGGAKIVNTYRADVLRFLDLDPNTANIVGNSTYQIMLADSGSGGSTTPFTLGATLVLVYRDVTSPTLNAVVIYDSSYGASNQFPVMTQTIKGFYQPVVTQLPMLPNAKLTHIVGNGQSNKSESITFSSAAGSTVGATVTLPPLYQTSTGTPLIAPFPGLYNGDWDNPTWLPNSYGGALVGKTGAVTTASTTVTPDPNFPNCATWGAIVLKTDVQDTDGDGLLDIWESQSNLTDPNDNPLPDLPSMGADANFPDIFVEIDYMSHCDLFNTDGTCASFHSHRPSQAVLDMVGDAFCAKDPTTNKCTRIKVHFDAGSGYTPDSYILDPTKVSLKGGNNIAETACSLPSIPSTSSCNFWNFPGTVGWKTDFLRYKNGDPTADPSLPIAKGYFDHSRKDMFHYALFAHTLGIPRFVTIDGTLISISVSGGKATVTTAVPHGMNQNNSVTISGAPTSANINGVYTVASVIYPNNDPTQPSTEFQVNVPNATPDPNIPAYKNYGLGVGNGTPRSTSGVGDIFGGDLMVTLGRWDGSTGSEFVQASTLMHELGHNVGLGHAGNVADPNNCKPNYQSVMNYLFQIAGLIGSDGQQHIDYSSVKLNLLDESSLNESTSILPGTVAQLPYLPRWYVSANNTQVSSLHIPPATFHCDGTPIPSNGAQMVRVDGDQTMLNGQIDWNYDGDTADTSLDQDINFSGGDNQYTGFNDWSNLKLNQLGARWNSTWSLDVRLCPVPGHCATSTDDFADLAVINTPTWPQVLSDWSDQGLLGANFGGGSTAGFGGGSTAGFGGGSTAGFGGGWTIGFGGGSTAGFGGGSSAGFGGGPTAGFGGGSTAGFGGGVTAGFGEQNVENAIANGNNPAGLVANAVKFAIDLTWNRQLALGSVPQALPPAGGYEVWRGTCPKTGPCTLFNSFPAVIATVTGAPVNCDGGTFMFCDFTAKNGVMYLYFVEAAKIVYPDGTTTKHSGPSNQVPKSR